MAEQQEVQGAHVSMYGGNTLQTTKDKRRNETNSSKSRVSLGVNRTERKREPARRRRGLQQARNELSKQFATLGRVVSNDTDVNGHGKAKILERAIKEVETLMNRATFLAVELAVSSPEATQNWVRGCAQGGHSPLLQTVATVMKLFAVRYDWRYGEWWTLDEADVNANVDNVTTILNTGQHTDDLIRCGEKRDDRVIDVGNIHGCAVRDSASAMRLSWTVVHHGDKTRFKIDNNKDDNEEGLNEDENDDDDGILEFARKSKSFKFGPRVGMPGRVWTSRRAEWLEDLNDRNVFLRSPLAEKFGMKSCLAVPIQFGGHVHSVMAFYSKQPRSYDPDAYDLACVLAQSLSEVYAPSRSAPWNSMSDSLFSPQSA